ncbi:MAG: iron-sulfur cluster assembly scaffold protein [Deltaproteobacteria bacterium]|nr:iron-sulfur cluster assembly scaffold protein [Deltaproteobacteria bacterium]
MASRYTDTVIDHFRNPRNLGIVENYNGKGITGDPECGDFLEVTIRMDEKSLQVSAVKFRCRGCPAAIASSSMMTTMVQSKDINEILCLTERDVVDALGGLPEGKEHCSVLGIQAIRDAIADYLLFSTALSQGLLENRAQYERMLNGKRITMGPHVCDGTCQTLMKNEPVELREREFSGVPIPGEKYWPNLTKT